MVDLDGTLFDTKKVNYLAYSEAMEVYGYSLDYDYYCGFCNGMYYKDFLSHIITADNEVVEAIHKSKCSNYVKYLNHARLNKKLIELIEILNVEYKIALVTTASKKNTMDILGAFNIVDKFDLILTKEDIKEVKPHPEGFLKAMDFFKASPEECIIFEDSDVGIMAAEQTGSTVFVVKGFN